MSKRSILVVDDDRSVRGYLSDFLTSRGYSVECLESGDQAVARLSTGYVPSLMVLDIVMPGISGVEAGDISWTNPKVLQIMEIAKHVADNDVPVLSSGESGVGKEVLARYIHTRSNRHDKPFVKVNCAALPNDLLESELFGYERGAF